MLGKTTANLLGAVFLVNRKQFPIHKIIFRSSNFSTKMVKKAKKSNLH